VAIDALPAVRRRHPSATLLVVSGLNPVERQEAEARARSLGVAEAVRFLGRLEDTALLSLFAGCDAYWAPTRYEGFGLTVLEAMAAGAPVMAADVPVVNEIVHDGENGLLFEPGRPEALAQITLRLLDDPALGTKLREAGRRTLADRFHGQRLVAEIEVAYAQSVAQSVRCPDRGRSGREEAPEGTGETAYFAGQVARSDRKVAQQHERLLRRAGLGPRLPGGLALDLGCGAGPGLRYFTQQGMLTVGLDRSRYALDEARRLASPRGLVQGDLGRDLPFRSECFGLVFASEVIEHLADGPAFLRECRRILRPGGQLVITTPNLWDLRRLFFPLLGRTWSGHADPTHINLYTPLRLLREMQEAGLRPRVRTGWKPMLWLPPYRRGWSIAYPPWVGNGIVASGTR
jgi:SAM-dependent methyltransferase